MNAQPEPPSTSAPRTDDDVRASGRGEVHGKVILIGEHAVVYGHPAIALPVKSISAQVELRRYAEAHIDSDLYVGLANVAPDEVAPVRAAVREVSEAIGFPHHEVGVTIRSTIPVARGLGSSAAVSAAIISAASEASGIPFTDDERYELIQSAERVAHGTPSGLDARTVMSDSPLLFQQGKATPLQVGRAMGFVIADTGNPSSTALALAGVRERRAARRASIDTSMARIGELTLTVRDALTAGDIATIGAAMNETHRLLQQIGVSSASLDALVAAAQTAGAVGAKLTGGGLGGCIIAAAPTPNAAADLADALSHAGAARAWSMTLETF